MAIADLVAQQGTRHATHHSTAVLSLTAVLSVAAVLAVIADTARFVDPLAGAFLARDRDVFVLGLDTAHACVVEEGLGVQGECCAGEQGDEG